MSATFGTGEWIEVEKKNFDAYCRAKGIGMIKRKMAATILHHFKFSEGSVSIKAGAMNQEKPLVDNKLEDGDFHGGRFFMRDGFLVYEMNAGGVTAEVVCKKS